MIPPDTVPLYVINERRAMVGLGGVFLVGVLLGAIGAFLLVRLTQ